MNRVVLKSSINMYKKWKEQIIGKNKSEIEKTGGLMKIKAVFMDLDGTLLRNNHTISEKIKNKLKELE